MTPYPDLADLAARALRRERVAPRPRSESQQANAIATVAAAIHAGRKRALLRRWCFGGLAVAAAMALTVGTIRRTPHLSIARGPDTAISPYPDSQPAVPLATIDGVVGEAFVLHRGALRPAVAAATVSVGDQVVVERGASVSLGLASGTHVTAEEGADLTVLAQGNVQRFRLAAGSVRAKVHKLAPNERFVVQTLDAEVEVRGTAFRVAAAASDGSCGSGTTTRLAVDEGVVTVRSGSSELAVSAGQSWPACSADAAVPGLASRSSTSQAAGASEARERTETTKSASPREAKERTSAPTRSLLEEQNDVYASAISARDRGDSTIAVSLFELLASHYPTSPLAENAMAERMKILAATSPGRALVAAKEYLAKYPTGSARIDAETIVAKVGAR